MTSALSRCLPALAVWALPSPAVGREATGGAAEAARRFEAGRTAQDDDDHAAAVPHLEAAVQAAPTWGLAHLALARSRRALQLDPAATRSALERATELAPRNPAAWGLLGTVLEEEGRPDEAGEAWQHVANLVPDDVRAHTRIGALALERGDLVLARSHLRIASGLDPGSVVGRTLLVEALERSGLIEEATRELAGYAEAHPDNPWVWRRLALLLRKHGDEAGAKAAERTAGRLESPKVRPRRRMRPLGPAVRR